jgi:ribosome biogenesis protein MAK21
VHWYFEHELKLKYAEYVQILEVCFPKLFKSHVHARFCYVHGQMTWWFSLFPILMQVNSKDTVATQRQQMIKHIYDLLNAKPEQERTLLSLIINKFVRSLASRVLVSLCSEVDSPPCLQGDLEKKISSSVVYQLTNLLQKHPGMKMAVVKEVQPLLYRANVSLRAQCVSLLCLPLSLFSPRV